MSGGGTSNLQGGAIYAQDGVNMEISACTFQQNEAPYVSAECEVVLKLFPQKTFRELSSNWGGGNLNCFREEQFISKKAL